MVDFNPDVQQVEAPSFMVTKPISRPEANKAKGELFATAGSALKETGELVKDTTKLIDFTNKEDLSNRINIKAGSERENRNIELETQNMQMTGILNDAPGDRAQADDPNMPPEVKNVESKAQRMAALREQMSQSDMYYRGRLNELAKYYRSAFPGYKDYIDKTFERYGFGNTANAYQSSLEKANLAIQNALQDKKSKTMDWLYSHPMEAPDGSYTTHQAILDIQQGKEGAEEKALRTFMPIAAHKATTEARQLEISNREKMYADNKISAKTHVADSVTGDVNNLMQTPEFQADLANLKEDNDPANQQILQRWKLALIKLRGAALNRDRKQWDEYTTDQTGNNIKTGNQYTNAGVLGEEYSKVVDDGVKPLTAAISAVEEGRFPLATAMKNMTAARHDAFASRMFTGTFANDWEGSVFLKENATPGGKTAAMESALFEYKELDPHSLFKGLIDSYRLQQTSEGYPAALQMETMGRNSVNNPGANAAVLNNLNNIKNPDFAPAAKANLVDSFYTTFPSVLTKMQSLKKTEQYSNMLSKDVLKEVKALPLEQQRKVYEWALHSYQNEILPPMMRDMESYVTREGKTPNSMYTITWNDEAHKWGINAFGIQGLEQPGRLDQIHSDLKQLGSVGTVRNLVDRVITPLNQANEGLTNLADGLSGPDVNAFVVSSMRAAGLDKDNKFWDALQQQSKAAANAKAAKDQDKPEGAPK